jgi:putative SOS response-associated peptidase YedK
MCFYYSIAKKSVNELIKTKILKPAQLNLFDDQVIANGFDHPFMPVITNDLPGEIQYFQWGFLPPFVDSIQDFWGKYNTLNAKAEEAAGSKLYAEALFKRRCLVLCSGFFEWKTVKKEKIPYYITLKNDEMFVFAGIWNVSTDSKNKLIRNFSILTIEANELMAEIHNSKKRMPLILSPENALKWISFNLSEQEVLDLLKPIPASEMKAHTVRKFFPSEVKNLNVSDVIAYYHYPAARDLFSSNNMLFD